MCESLLNRNNIQRMITGNENWSLTTTLSENDRGRKALSRRKRWSSQN